MKLVLKDCKNEKLTAYPGEDGSTQVLAVRCLLTRTLAEQLRCRDLCFAESGVPRRFGELKLNEKIENAEIVFAEGTYLANSVSHFKIGRPKEASETDNSLEVAFNLHFDGAVPLRDWFDNQNKAQYSCAVKPPKEWRPQGELFAEATEGEDGDDPDTGCVACNNAIPLAEGDPTKHASGAECTRKDAEQPGPVLASAREAAGGTHQRKRRGQIPEPAVQ